MSIQSEIEELQAKRVRFRTAGLICGFAALTVGVWGGAVAQLIGGLIFFLWLVLLICGFIFRSVAVGARNNIRFLTLRLQADGLTPDLSPLNSKPVVDPALASAAWNTQTNVPSTAQPKAEPAAESSSSEPTIESRLAKARRTKN